MLHSCPHIKIDRVLKGGSFGRRTMVSGNFDVDVSVFVISFDGQLLDWERDWHDEHLVLGMLRTVALWLSANSHSQVVVVEQGTHYKNVINVRIQNVDMDLKLVPQMGTAVLSKPGPKQAPQDRAYAQQQALMRPVLEEPEAHDADPTREAALSEALAAAVKPVNDRVKVVCRMVKAWYKLDLATILPTAGVPSVALEMLVLAAHQEVLRRGRPKWAELSAAVLLESLRLLDEAVTHGSLVVLDAGRKWGYRRETAERFRHVWGSDPVKILHPIDPTCNLARVSPSRSCGRRVDFNLTGWYGH
ncbi:hypothetical protein GPECTOR_5g417 [Gonium pectorale]|uniref:Uncharacterized protein n=1 Tax=Gonium pectorale TaxID=33097 RepID=A0A150GWZ5_GONPE|nr:hypothetical protein GPECTOR_5g417 [Gonium pectorale]|eukprot:KXZ54334.1 hypothetical protein GPECTOR_5g417 [Gonium pectorale]